jgi:F420H(2)-dependent biliverdin reductase
LEGRNTVAPGANRAASSMPISLRPPKITISPPSVSFTAVIMSCATLGSMAKATTRLTAEALAFLTERHLAMLTTLRSDTSPHVVAVGFTFDPKTHIARVITSGGSQKAVNADQQGVAVLSQVDGARWLSLEGKASVNTDADAVRDAELRYAQRYRTPRVNPRRVVIEVRVERVLGSSDLLDRAED